jgi:hypothetical protein
MTQKEERGIAWNASLRRPRLLAISFHPELGDDDRCTARCSIRFAPRATGADALAVAR